MNGSGTMGALGMVGALGGAVSAAWAGPTVLRVLVGDLTLDQIYLTADVDGDGDTDDPGETTVYFDATNASGLANPTSSVFNIHQAPNGVVYFGDGGADAVYRLRDLNEDGDAQDAGEANVWFSAAGNFYGFGLPTPNGVYSGPGGAIFISNAGTGAIPSDAIYRTQDLNGDGDANDENEATLWMDLQTLFANSAPFDLVFIGDTVYVVDTVAAGTPGVIRAADANANGTIEAGEFNVFIDESSPLGVGIGTAIVTDGTSLYVSESLSSAFQTVYRLTDLNANGVIDNAAEAVQVWNEGAVPVGFTMGSSFGMAIGPGGELMVGSAGADSADNLFRLVDVNSDGDFLDAGETTVWAYADSGPNSFIENPRAPEYLRPPCVGDLDGSGDVGFADLLVLLGEWGPCPPSPCNADLDGTGDVGFSDLLVLLASWGDC